MSKSITDEEVESIMDSLISGDEIDVDTEQEAGGDTESIDDEENYDDDIDSEDEHEDSVGDSDVNTDSTLGSDDENNSDDNSDDIDDSESDADNENDEDNESDEDGGSQGANNQEQADEDFKKKYEELAKDYERVNKFYQRVTSPFKANGQEIRIDDPEKIIRGLQMSVGYTDKMRKFKEYRPFLTPLREKGILDNPEKFNTLIDAMEGNKDALKKLISDANINPMELTSDDTDTEYTPTDYTANDFDIAFEDLMDSSRQAGIEQPLVDKVLKTWDDASIAELVMDKQSASDIVQQIDNGAFDLVQKRIREKEVFDPAFTEMPAIEKYRNAASEVEQEFIDFLEQEALNGNPDAQYGYELATGKSVQPEPNNTAGFDEAQIQAEMERIVQERKYAAKIEQQKQSEQKRSKAASFNNKRTRTNKRGKQEPVDPMDLSDSEIEDILSSLISG